MIQIIEQDNYRVALDLAREELSALDPQKQALRCGARLVDSTGGKVIELKYLDCTCEIDHPGGAIRIKGRDDSLSEWEQILVLHYLISRSPVPPEGEPIVFSQVPSGVFYDSAFKRRVKNHFLSVFSRRPELLEPAAEKLGGEKYESSGDVSVSIPPLPKVSLYFVLWKADEEFPADMNLLMSSTIASYLPTEDIAVLGGIAAGKLIKHAGEL